MKMRSIIFLAFLFAFVARADERVTMRITITNLPVTGNNLSFSVPASKVITWSNTTASSWVSTNTTKNGSATNLFSQLASFAPWTPRPALVWANTNAFDLVGEVNQAILATNGGSWATLTLSTQTVTRLTTVRVPISSEVGDTNRTNVASLLVKGMTDHSTNSIGSNSIALAHALQLSTNAQQALGPKKFNQLDTSTNITTIYGGTNAYNAITNSPYIHGSNVNFWGGYSTNIKADKMISTSLVNYGSAISSPGPSWATSAEQFGSGAVATNTTALAVGANSVAGGQSSTALGRASQSLSNVTVAVGDAAIASGFAAMALGASAEATYDYSIALGAGAEARTNRQFYIGGEVYHILTGARAEFGLGVTNATLTGTNVNKGDWADEEVTVSTLANGNNIAVSPTNVFMRLVAGPTAAFTINGIQNGRSGKQLWLYNDTGQQMTLAHESGVDPTPANRIYCTSGGDIVFGTNALTLLKYSAAKSRWIAQINTNAITLANNSVTDGILRDSAALSVIGRSANSTGDPADISAGADGLFLGRSNSTLGFIKVGLTNLSMYNVNPVSQSAGQVLAWDGTSNIWTNKTLQLTNSSLSNVNPVGQSTNNALIWNGSHWTNAPPTGIALACLTSGVASLNPVDSTTYYFGLSPDSALQTTESTSQFQLPMPTGWTGKVKAVSYNVQVGGSLGTTENVAHYVRNVTTTTDSSAVNITYDAARKNAYDGTLNLAVSAGDLLVIKVVCPAWVTNPTTVRIWAHIYIE